MTTAADALPILHHYDFSPFAEKVRLALGLKGIHWRSVIAPSFMPKPDLVALTGGYRHIPVLQVGADVFCDTRTILRELDRRVPSPPLIRAETAGVSVAYVFVDVLLNKKLKLVSLRPRKLKTMH